MVKHYEITKIDKDRYSVHKRDSYGSGGGPHPLEFEDIIAFILLVFIGAPIGGGIFFGILGLMFEIKWLGFMLGTKLGFAIGVIYTIFVIYITTPSKKEN